MTSLNNDELWKPNRLFEATCLYQRPEPHVPPVSNCSCGIYALKFTYEQSIGSGICGEVALWGEIFEDDHPVIRGQYAYPIKLYTENPWYANDVIYALARYYGCDAGAPLPGISKQWGEWQQQGHGGGWPAYCPMTKEWCQEHGFATADWMLV